MTAPLAHDAIVKGQCIDCVRVEQYAHEFSICWACGHVIDHATGHACASYDHELA